LICIKAPAKRHSYHLDAATKVWIGCFAKAKQHTARRIQMNIDRAVLAFAGTVILISLALAQFVSPHWFWLTAFVGLNLLQASFSGVCPMAILLRSLGVKDGKAF
jgi:Protein of unknown function (DUF2892)